jgi:hypothetical protein
MSPSAISSDAVAPAAPGPLRRLADRLFGDDGLSFTDVLDLVNPLQHIPVVGNVYRELTGDTLAPGIRVAGGALFGGPLGAALSVAGLVIDSARDDGATDMPDPADTAVAAAGPAPVPRGGWLLAAVSMPVAPALPAATVPSAVEIAGARPDAPAGQDLRRSPGADPASPAQALSSRAADAARERRGGWLLAQAYALEDAIPAGRRVAERA